MSDVDFRPRRDGRRLISACVFIVTLAVAVAACGESQTPPTYAAVDGYLTSLAQGNYATACTYLNGRGRRSLAKATGSHKACAKVFDHCLPDQVRSASKDQTQLNYATVDITTKGAKGSATVAGTAVARMVKRVDLAREGRRWKLATYGEGLKGCRAKAARRKRT